MSVRSPIVLLLALALGFAAATGAIAAPGGEPGKPADAGKPAHAPGYAKKAGDASHDPSNPDGTYQGKSPSKPDQDGIGADHGIDNNDKTGPGTDGNNGCGNDADREDDNNGWCGRKPAPEVSPTETESPETTSPSPQAEVLGEKLVKPTTEVLGLALTGSDIRLVIAAALMLLVTGFGIRTIARKPSA